MAGRKKRREALGGWQKGKMEGRQAERKEVRTVGREAGNEKESEEGGADRKKEKRDACSQVYKQNGRIGGRQNAKQADPGMHTVRQPGGLKGGM